MRSFISKLLLILSTLLLFLSQQSLVGQEVNNTIERLTDGTSYWEYSDSDLFKFLKKKYWDEWKEKRRFKLADALANKVLLVKLVSHEKKIKALQKVGKTEEAEQLALEDKQNNQDIMAGFADHYTIGDCYFYYPKDSRKILLERDFSSIYDANLKPVPNFEINNQAYVLMYKSLNVQGAKKFHIHLWDLQERKMIRLKKHTFGKLNPRVNHYESIKNFAVKLSQSK